MRVGIFGGTFDPVHNGHLRAAEEIGESFSLEKVYFVPAYIPPHKNTGNISAMEDRLAMVRLAIKGNRRFSASDAELRRGGISYSIDTIEIMEKRFKDVYYLIGVDAFDEIDTWHRYEDLFYHTNFIVMVRPNHRKKSGLTMFPKNVRKQMTPLNDSSFQHNSGRQVYLQLITQLDISATRIRTSVGSRKSIRYLVPPAVETYIKEKGLYQ